MLSFPGCSFGPPARRLALAILSVGAAFGPLSQRPVMAQTAQTDADPVLAKVNSQPIHLSDLKAAAARISCFSWS